MPPHSTLSTTLNSKVTPYVEKIYEKLSTQALLDSCSNKGTQNANECLHNTLWSLCSKVYIYIYKMHCK